jgi:predicted acylesterase/phospholipase RssA
MEPLQDSTSSPVQQPDAAAQLPHATDDLPMLPGGLVNIALSFSGGGFRAASFCLGCFAYLDQSQLGDQKLSERVKFISSSSGGSFASMSIVYAQRKKELFRDAYRRLHDALHADDLLKRVHKILETNDIWEQERPDKERNLINAFAIAYDQVLFSGDTFDVIWNETSPGTVPEICVNATDFTHGQQFRFQHDGTTTYRGEFGSKYLNIQEGKGTNEEKLAQKEKNLSVIRKIKLGDILAVSSCFPGGFEPILFPSDFTWAGAHDGLTSADLENALESDARFVNSGLDKKEQNESFAFMDGGIVDNQGIDAFLLAENRLNSEQAKTIRAALSVEEKQALKNPELSATDKEAVKQAFKAKRDIFTTPGFDLFAACDVSSNFTDEYIPVPNSKSIFLKPSLVAYLLIFLGAFLLGCYGAWFGAYASVGYILIGFFALPVLTMAVTVVVLGVRFMRTWFSGPQKQEDSLLSLFGGHIWYLINIPLHRLTGMLTARATSLVALSTTVFLKKIRQNAYAAHLRSGLSGKAVKTFVARAVSDKILDVLNFSELNQLCSNLKSWTDQTINPTVHMLASKNSQNLQSEMKREGWDHGKTMVEKDGQEMLLFEALQPGKAILEAADLAASMGTTLWFDKKNVKGDMRAALIATGQFSMCHSLLRFSHRFGNNDPEWQKWKEQLLNHWLEFQKDPYWLHKKIKSEFDE